MTKYEQKGLITSTTYRGQQLEFILDSLYDDMGTEDAPTTEQGFIEIAYWNANDDELGYTIDEVTKKYQIWKHIQARKGLRLNFD